MKPYIMQESSLIAPHKMAPHLPKQPQQCEGGQPIQQMGTWCHFLIDLTPPNSLLDVSKTFFLVLCPERT